MAARRGKRILVVDDNRDVLRLVDEALTAAGYEVTTAASGAEAVRQGTRVLPSLVLLDIGLPDCDGFTVYRRLRERPAALDCPIIFLTAQGDISSRLLGFQHGAVDYIVKPFHVRELLARVKVHLHEQEPVSGDVPNPLTERELDAVRLLASGKTYKQVATALGVSQSTVRNHLHSVYHKIDVVDRAQAVIVCRENDWI